MRKRDQLHVACEELNMIWTGLEVQIFEAMWMRGNSIGDIADYFGRDVDEIALLVIDRARAGRIIARPYGVHGQDDPMQLIE